MDQSKSRTYTAAELVDRVGGKLKGDPALEINGVSSIENPEAGTIVFAENKEYFKQAKKSKASLVITNITAGTDDAEIDYIIVDKPRLAYARIARLFAPEPYNNPGIHPTAQIADTAELGENLSIHANVIINQGASIGDNVILAPGVYVGQNVVIGDNTLVHPRVVIEYDSIIGKDVIIQSGTVIGSDGYGYTTTEEGHHKIPQLGRVIIEDKVEIGANVTIDRGTNQATRIKQGTKIDNLVQIGHNVEIGEENLIVAQVGIGGSCQLGQRVTVAGQAGIVDHTEVGDNVTIASNSLVTKDTPDGVFYSGNPAQDHKQELKEQAVVRRLPKLSRKLKEMEKRIKKLEKKDRS